MQEFETSHFIHLIKQKDPVSTTDFVKHYTGKMFSAVMHLGFKKEEAEDIVQNTWITFFDVVTRFEGRSKLKTFLYGVLYNKVSEFKKRNFRHKDIQNIDDLINENFDTKNHWIQGPISPDTLSMATETLGIIEKCLEVLPIKQKLAFQLKEIEEEATEEICKLLEISISNLGVLLFRARNQLRLCVESKSVGGTND
jgi:RNA polymerase sigma-70 factor (ECF subfamily)